VLEGLKVVELSTYVAGPSAAMVLGEWGAEVVKIESRAGDPTRHTFAAQPHLRGNPVFEFENRGKRGVVLDTSRPAGRDALVRILADADIFITNLRPGALKRARLDYATLKAQLPRLIYANVTGYGLQGPAADLPAFDIAAFWTRSGVAAAATAQGHDPVTCPAGMGDEFTAMSTVSAILAAVFRRVSTGEGQHVETSLLRAGVFANGWNTAIQLKYGKLAATRPRDRQFNPLTNYWPTADGRWVCTVTRHGFDDWGALTRAAGKPELMDDERFAKGRDRAKNVAELVALLDEGFRALSLEELGARLTAADVAWAPLQTPADVAQDPVAAAAGCFEEITDGLGDTFLAPATPARFPGHPTPPRRPAPGLGQHTREVLAEAGYGEAEIDALIAEGAAS
jgi:crotonobetainyl-CoA:carnitine CoA-transferase CaiB-like acyl-CoA transferase